MTIFNGIKDYFSRISKTFVQCLADCKKTLKHPARIVQVRCVDSKTYFKIQLIGKCTCTNWLSAFNLIQNYKLYSSLNPAEQTIIKNILKVEYLEVVEEQQDTLLISAIDFEPTCLMHITNIEGVFRMKMSPKDILCKREIFEKLNSDSQAYVKFYSNLKFQKTTQGKNNIISFQAYRV